MSYFDTGLFRSILLNECNDGNIIFNQLTTSSTKFPPTAFPSSTTFCSTTTLSTITTPEDFTWPNPQASTMMIKKNASLDWEDKKEKARECLLDYLARRGNLKPISEWVEPEGTTAWTMVVDIVTNQFSVSTYKDYPIIILLALIFLQ